MISLNCQHIIILVIAKSKLTIMTLVHLHQQRTSALKVKCSSSQKLNYDTNTFKFSQQVLHVHTLNHPPFLTKSYQLPRNLYLNDKNMCHTSQDNWLVASGVLVTLMTLLHLKVQMILALLPQLRSRLLSQHQ